jgi:flagellar FliJ protein
VKKFKYRFEKVLTVRRHQEKEKQRELAQVVLQQQKQQDKIDEINRSRRRTQGEQRSQLVGKLNPLTLTWYSRFYLRLKHEELTGKDMLRQIGREVNKRRLALLEASKGRKIYEKLREKHLENYTAEMNRLMQKENDEIGQKVFLRNR